MLIDNRILWMGNTVEMAGGDMYGYNMTAISSTNETTFSSFFLSEHLKMGLIHFPSEISGNKRNKIL